MGHSSVHGSWTASTHGGWIASLQGLDALDVKEAWELLLDAGAFITVDI